MRFQKPNFASPIFGGLVSKAAVAQDLDVSIRTVENYILAGLACYGPLSLLDPREVAEYLRGTERRTRNRGGAEGEKRVKPRPTDAVKRKRGRPRKNATG